MTSTRPVIFTDLDATLLDHDSYDWSPAASALARLAERGIPVCLCTSKTVAEVQTLRAALDLDTPFATENGSVVAVPPGYFGAHALGEARREQGLDIVTLGHDYAALRDLTTRLKAEHGFDFTGFGDMDTEAVMAATGLDREAAAAARQRDASEPLLWRDSEAAEAEFARLVAAAGATTRRGGRFLHVLGHADKRDALAWLRAGFEASGPILAVALGDSANDADMLAAADVSWWVARPDGSYFGPATGSMRHAEGIGPTGWAAAIHTMLAAGEI